MNTVFSYFDYQLFLRDYYDEQKKEASYFSYRYLGDKMGLDAGFLVKVLQGKMHLSLKSVPSIAKYFKFDIKESEYFETLVRYGRAVSESEIKAFFEKLLSLKDVDADPVLANQYEFYQKWYYSAIRELLGFYDFKGDFTALAVKLSPRISAKEAKKAVALLDQLKLICKDETGRYRQTNSFITTSDKWKSAAIHSFQKETIRLAGESLERHPKHIRDVSTITIAVSHKDFEEIRRRISDFRRSLLQMTNENEADCVYQINLQAVPLTQIEDDQP
jgi:uncharacterized protein (TIGR02147 family)